MKGIHFYVEDGKLLLIHWVLTRLGYRPEYAERNVNPVKFYLLSTTICQNKQKQTNNKIK